MIIAHAAGIVCAGIVTTIASSDPDAGEAIGVVIVGALFSIPLFGLALLWATLAAEIVYKRLLGFVLLGPVVVGAISIGWFGLHLGSVAALSAAISSLVFFRLAKIDNPAMYVGED